MKSIGRSHLHLCILACLAVVLAACGPSYPDARDAPLDIADEVPEYVIGPLDTLEVFVWRSPELSREIPVRPDGRISTPLNPDMLAAGKTSSQLSTDIAEALRPFVQEPIVTVIVRSFGGPLDDQIRVVGEAQTPVAIPYRANMTLLDVMIEVGGLTEFADGNRAVLIRGRGDNRVTYRLRLEELLRDGEVDANVAVLPGDIVLIPESFL
ncbi:XrtA/PEP-CTERM system exopolysaccharide export protein [Algihabitans albus]|uniref:XrtA/PEP-CTERM system exopolysaccharide export protein n=1 Tax=Algihabitans albus TaxID=2164067 RepID=UPI001ABD186C|nr:XrtA/PEP-CTERM system exopolysaccharide export protein [Algihabitans albus]